MQDAVGRYDATIARGDSLMNDEQLRRIAELRTYRGDRIRLCKFQPIIDARALPLIAIREFIISRKSLGGIQTDLQSRVLDAAGQPIPGLYAVGEAAGFGGGGMHGLRALEGTFLGGCILSGRIAAASIAGRSSFLNAEATNEENGSVARGLCAGADRRALHLRHSRRAQHRALRRAQQLQPDHAGAGHPRGRRRLHGRCRQPPLRFDRRAGDRPGRRPDACRSGIGEAFLDGIPMLVLSGGMRTDTGHRYQLHQMDMHKFMSGLTKATFRVKRHDEVVPTLFRGLSDRDLAASPARCSSRSRSTCSCSPARSASCRNLPAAAPPRAVAAPAEIARAA